MLRVCAGLSYVAETCVGGAQAKSSSGGDGVGIGLL